MLTDIPVDFSALSTTNCARKYQLTCVQGLDTSSKDTNWGSAFHKFIEARNRGCEEQIPQLVLPIAKQFELTPADAAQLITTCLTYDNTERLHPPAYDAGNNPLVEWKFSFPFLTTDKYRILLTGTVDLIYQHNDYLVFRDYKTTAVTNAAAEKKERGYITSFQIPFYLYCLQHHLHNCLSPQANELLLQGRIHGEYQLIYKSYTPAKIKVTPPIRPWPRDEIESVLYPLIGRIINTNDLNTLAPKEGTTNGTCEQCAFSNACLTYDIDTRDNILKNFRRRIYDPMNFR